MASVPKGVYSVEGMFFHLQSLLSLGNLVPCVVITPASAAQCSRMTIISNVSLFVDEAVMSKELDL